MIIHPDLELLDKFVFKVCGLELSNFETELESQEYSASSFCLNGRNVKYRVAKITPAKIGQFVTIWKRNDKGVTQPFSISDNIDIFIIAARQQNQLGFFVFPKSALHERKILQDNASDGKRGIRVYPAWDLPTSSQAQKTQQWQTEYFLEITPGKVVDLRRAEQLFEVNS